MGGMIGPCGGYRTVQDEGVDLPRRRIVDFAGAGVTATDDAANERTLVTIPGGGGAVGGSGLFDPFQSGFWYGPQLTNIGSLATPTNGNMHLSMLFVPSATTFDRIGVIMTSTSGVASLTRLGIYNNADYYPTSLVLDAGTVNGAAAGVREESIVISQTLAAGLYWLAGVNQTGGSANTVYGHTALIAHNFARSTLTDLVPQASGYAYLRAGTAGALPSPLAAGLGYVTTASAIRVFLRAA